ncbi:VCBS repeat-containing protein, partial [Rhodonellum sp.]|uniref:FG-GAP repeat domain-containing protein n=1 Tax=Rhodonellum sp. TaxID=2231180 RepID=UPI002725079E
MNFNRLLPFILLFFVFQHTHVIAQTNPDKTIPGARTWRELIGEFNCTLPLEYDANPFTIRRAAWTVDDAVVTFGTPIVGDFIPGNGKTEVLILKHTRSNAINPGVGGTTPEWNWITGNPPRQYVTRNIIVYTYGGDGAGGLVKEMEIETPDLNFEGPSPFLIARVPGYLNPLVIVATSSTLANAPTDAEYVDRLPLTSRLIAYDHLSTNFNNYRWISSQKYGANVPESSIPGVKYRSGAAPGIANFDLTGANPYPSVYVYNEIFSLNPATSNVGGNIGNNKVFDGGNLGQGIMVTTPGGGNTYGGSQSVSVAADVVPGNNTLELVSGNTVYVIDENFNLVDAIQLNINGFAAPDGFTSIANIDQTNNRLDIVVSTARQPNVPNSRLVYVWTIQGGTANLIASKNLLDAAEVSPAFHEATLNTGLAFIGDIDGNGQSEIGVTSPLRLNMLYYNGSPVLQEKWPALVTNDESGHTLITMFDFNQDGKQELVYRDENLLRIIGGNGDNIITIPVRASTAGDGAVVADLSGDGQADILVTDSQDNIYDVGNRYPRTPDAKLVVFKSNGFPWAPSRSVWNQYAYFSFNVNDDLSIPIPQQDHGLEQGMFFPSYDPEGCLIADRRPFNSFLVQRTLFTESGCFSSGIPIMDAKVDLLAAKFLCLDAGNNQIEVELTISNAGDEVMPAEVRIEFTLGTTIIDNVAIEQIVAPGGSFTKTIVINSSIGDNPVLPLFAIINPPDSNGDYAFPECTNDGPVTIPVIPRPVFVVDPPEAICEGDLAGIFIEVINATAGSVDNAVVKWYKDTPNGTLITDGTIGLATYSIGPDFSLQIDNLPASATAYKFYLVDECSNRTPQEVLVTVDPSPTILFEVDEVKCFGGDTGVITAILGDQPYISYSLDNGATFITSAQLLARTFSAGIYNVTVKASLNPPAACLADFQFTIGEPDLFEFSNPSQTEPLCAPTTGAISWDIQGGNPTITFPFYTYTLTKNGTAVTGFVIEEIDGKNVINGLDGGDYVLTATDSKGCTIPQNFSLITQEDPIFSIQDAAAICFGEEAVFDVDMTNTGVAIAVPSYEWGKVAGGVFTPIVTGQTVDGGVATIDNNGKRLTISGLPASATEYAYQVRISGENTCNQVPLDTKIKVNPLPDPEFEVVNVSCFGDANGSISLANTLTGTFNFSLVGPSNATNTSGDFTGLPAGSYAITVTNTVTNCEITLDTIDISQPDPLVLQGQVIDQPSCGENTGSYAIDFQGGTAPFTLVLSLGGTPLETIPNFSGSNYSKSGLAPGDYVFTVTDAEDCSITDSFTLVNDPKLPIGLVLDDLEICEGDIATFQPIINTSSNPRTVKWFYDALGQDQIFAGVDPSVAGVSYALDGENLLVTGLKNGGNRTYFVEVSGDLYCPILEPVEVTIFAIPVPEFDKTDILCNGEQTGKIFLTAGVDPKLEYSVNGATAISQTALELLTFVAGTYEIGFRHVDTNCGGTVTLVIEEPLPLVLSNQTLGQPSCGDNNGSYSIDLQGGTAPFTLVLSLGATVLETISNFDESTYSKSGLAPGAYAFTLTDANFCPIADSFTLTNDPKLPIGLVLDDLEICEGDIATFQPIINTSGNPRTVTWFYDALGQNQVAAGADPSDAGVSYQLVGENLVVTGIKNGSERTYFLEVSGNLYCPIIEEVNVTASPPLIVAVDVPDAVCFGEGVTVTVNASGGEGLIEYSLDNGLYQSSNVFENTAIGTHILAVRSENGCTYQEIIEIFGPTEPITLEDDVVIIGATCGQANGIIQNVNVIGGWGDFTVEWRKDNATTGTVVGTALSPVENLSPGTYFLVVTDEKGCVEIFEFIVPQQPLPDLVLVDQVICEGPDVLLTPAQTVSGASSTDLIWYKDAAGTVLIQNGPDGTFPQVNYTVDGDYALLIEGLPAGVYTYYLKVVCTDELKSVNVTVNAAPNPVLSKVDILCFGAQTGKIQVTDNSDPDFRYSINGETPITQAEMETRGYPAGTYEIEITQVGTDCSSDQTIIISQPEEFIFTAIEKTDPTCGSNDGIIKFSVAGGVKDYTITINNQPLSTFNFSETVGVYTVIDLALGNYDIVITDANDCVFTKVNAFSLVDDNILTVQSNNLNSIICEGESAILTPDLTISGGVNPTKKWFRDAALTELIEDNYVAGETGPMFGINDATGVLTVYNLPVGDFIYYLEISDPLICTVSSRADIKVTAIPNPVLDKVDILCFGAQTGKIQVT